MDKDLKKIKNEIDTVKLFTEKNLLEKINVVQAHLNYIDALIQDFKNTHKIK